MTTAIKERVAFSRKRGAMVATHEWFREFAARINENPAEAEGWLVLSDRLRDAGLDRCADLIVSLWGDGSVVPPDGDIVRGFSQWENGGSHWVGVSVSVENGQWIHHYWANGNFRSEVTREQARDLISWQGQPWRHERREKWTGDVTVVEGLTRANQITIAAG